LPQLVLAAPFVQCGHFASAILTEHMITINTCNVEGDDELFKKYGAPVMLIFISGQRGCALFELGLQVL
jgi:hypothetical protein